MLSGFRAGEDSRRPRLERVGDPDDVRERDVALAGRDRLGAFDLGVGYCLAPRPQLLTRVTMKGASRVDPDTEARDAASADGAENCIIGGTTLA
jgi:hypothetical protein